MLQRSVIPVEFSSFAYFRSPAFLNHPLNNALITVSLAPILMSRTKVPTLIYFSITLLALFAFGGRGAMALFIFGSAILSFDSLKKFFTVGVRVSRQRFALMQALFFVALISLVLILVVTSFFFCLTFFFRVRFCHYIPAPLFSFTPNHRDLFVQDISKVMTPKDKVSSSEDKVTIEFDSNRRLEDIISDLRRINNNLSVHF